MKSNRKTLNATTSNTEGVIRGRQVSTESAYWPSRVDVVEVLGQVGERWR
jgi:hypothetical protein